MPVWIRTALPNVPRLARRRLIIATQAHRILDLFTVMADIASGGAAVATTATEQRAEGATLAEEFREGDCCLNALIASDIITE